MANIQRHLATQILMDMNQPTQMICWLSTIAFPHHFTYPQKQQNRPLTTMLTLGGSRFNYLTELAFPHHIPHSISKLLIFNTLLIFQSQWFSTREKWKVKSER